MEVATELMRIIDFVNMLRRFNKVRRVIRDGGTPHQSMRFERMEMRLQDTIIRRMFTEGECRWRRGARRQEEEAEKNGGRREVRDRQRLIDELQGALIHYPDVQEILRLMRVVFL